MCVGCPFSWTVALPCDGDALVKGEQSLHGKLQCLNDLQSTVHQLDFWNPLCHLSPEKAARLVKVVVHIRLHQSRGNCQSFCKGWKLVDSLQTMVDEVKQTGRELLLSMVN
jgi:hypothetical protein